MSRDISAPVIAATQDDPARPVLLVSLDYASGFVRLTSLPYDVVYDGHTYSGVGSLGGISPVEEGSELQSYRLDLTLSDLPADFIALALGEDYQGRDARIYLGLVDAGHVLIDEPMLLFRGRMDTQHIAMGPETGSVRVRVESRMADWERPRVRRYTDADQRARFPGDRGFEFVEQIPQNLNWGRS
jgi:hypothetical protein